MAVPMDKDVLREIPGYRAILKSVLKSQIQLLMEQLSSQTGEESIILTASMHDGSLSHLGSSTGKGFLEGRDEIKAQFLGYCLKSMSQVDTRSSSQLMNEAADSLSYQRNRTLLPPSRRPRPRIRPGPYTVTSPGANTPPMGSPPVFHHMGPGLGSASSAAQYPMSSPHTVSPSHHSNAIISQGQGHSQSQGHTSTAHSIKSEDTTVTSVETFLDTVSGMLVAGSGSINTTGQSHSQGQSETLSQTTDSKSTNQNAATDDQDDQETESGQEDEGKDADPRTQADWDEQAGQDEEAAVNLGGIAFPGLDNAHHDFPRILPELSPAELKNALYPQGIVTSNGLDLSHKPDALTPRKRGRPRKDTYMSLDPSQQRPRSSILPQPSVNTAADNAPSLTDSSFLMRKRGRPKKQIENLPPGVVHPTGISIGNGYVKCNICGKILKSTSMFTHKQSHLGIRNYSCEYCGKSFTQKGPLITHKRVHTGEKPYSCGMCGKAFSAHSGLYQHRRRCSRHHALPSQLNMAM